MDTLHASTAFGIGGAWLAEYTLTSLGAGMLVFDTGGRCTQWDTTAAALLGVTEQELAGQSLFGEPVGAFHHGGDVMTAATDPVARVLETADPVSDLKIGVRSQDGEQKWLSLSLLPVFGVDRAPRAVLGSIVDVTSTVSARESVASWCAMARALLHDNLTANVVVDRFGQIVDWNSEALRLLERSDLDMLNCSFHEICDIDIDWVWEQVEDEHCHSVEGATWAVRGGGREVPVHSRFSVIHWPDVGPTILAQLLNPATYVPLDQNGRVPVASDVFEAAQFAMLILDSAGRIIDVNQRASELLGRGRCDLAGQRAVDYIDGVGTDELLIKCAQAAAVAAPVSLGSCTTGTAAPAACSLVAHVSALSGDAQAGHFLLQLIAV